MLALRFDIDSIRCLEEGVPRLRALAAALGVRFTFFVNMGYSFNLRFTIRALLDRRRGARGAPRHALPTTVKLGAAGVLRTVLSNPRLGDAYRAEIDALAEEGHELGLHGGTDHVIWQRGLETLGPEELEALFRPAYETFRERYGRPAGFASPGFQYNELVLDLIDRAGFQYASDMDGIEPFRPGNPRSEPWRHHQVPVNVIGRGRVPVIEEGLALGHAPGDIADDLVRRVREHSFAVAYGHPYVEGVRSDILGDALERLLPDREVLTMSEYLDRWRDRSNG